MKIPGMKRTSMLLMAFALFGVQAFTVTRSLAANLDGTAPEGVSAAFDGYGGNASFNESGFQYDSEDINIYYEKLTNVDSAINNYETRFKDVSSDLTAVQEMKNMATELRNESVVDMEKAYHISYGTVKPQAIGTPNLLLMESSKEKAVQAAYIANTPPPFSLNVETMIKTTVPSGELHYMLLGEYLNKSGSWQSYEFGMSMRIGRYKFRVQSSSLPYPYLEDVVVINQPTQCMITPLQ